MNLESITKFIPEVKEPGKKLEFKEKAKWTLIVLVAFFVLANIPLFGLSENALARFEFLAVILATDFGSLISLGIGPIVTASIILQLLSGAGILPIDLGSEQGKKTFQSLQTLLTLFFIVFEAIVFVKMGGLQANPGFSWLLILQLILGGVAIYYMDQVITKWGIGSGISLFIAAGIGRGLITQTLQFIDAQGRNCLMDFSGTPCSGKLLILIQSLIQRQTIEFTSAFIAIAVTILIFLAVVWAQSLKIEIPLSYGRIRGYTIRWPLSFFYASVIPVIFTAALIANIQLFGGILSNAAAPCLADANACAGMAKFASYFSFLGRFDASGNAISGLAFWAGSTHILELFLRGAFLPVYILQSITHILLFVSLSTLFAVFWVKTAAGLDAKSQAKKISASGLQIAGFRQDERVLESILDRYIMPLTVMGGIAIGILASVTNLLGALVSGTGILLVIMITYQLYQTIGQQHPEVINPSIGKFVGSA